MPRKKKVRHCLVSATFKGQTFRPDGLELGPDNVIAIYRDELEALRLCDKERLTQAEAGRLMGVSRGTVQRILQNARAKVAMALSECKALVMDDIICG